MIISYYDKKEKRIKDIMDVEEIAISLDYETGLLMLRYEINHLYFSIKLPITTPIVIGGEND